MSKTCCIDGCDLPVRAKGYCNPHYIRLRTLGDPLAGGEFRGKPYAWLRANASFSGNECLIWPFARNNRGYGRIRKDGIERLAHREMACIAIGPPPSAQHQAAHSCGNGHLGCCSPRHLRWASNSENQMDRIIHGTSNRGMANGKSVHSEETVLRVVEMRRSGALYDKIHSLLGVPITTISLIMTGRNWSWLTGIQKKTSEHSSAASESQQAA
jgi:hypothetical protein